MHFFVLTEAEENIEEKYWPEGFKKVIRTEVEKTVSGQITQTNSFLETYRTYYPALYGDYNEFVAHLTRMVAIGAENGADAVFDEIYSITDNKTDLPQVRMYARYFWPQVHTKELEREIEYAIIGEYRQEEAYNRTYEDHFKGNYQDFNEFLSAIARLVTSGTVNGADDTIDRIYQALLRHEPIPTIRKRPKRLKL